VIERLHGAVARIHASDGAVVGAGFLVGERQVLTCAHVVARALHLLKDTTDAPSDEIPLSFPLINSDETCSAHIVRWDRRLDIAGLELEVHVAATHPVDLLETSSLWRHSFGAFGFPAGYDDGVWTEGVLRGRTGAQWIQLDGLQHPNYWVEPGFSGTAIWDLEHDGAVGMAVAADLSPEVDSARMIPAATLLTAWPEIPTERNHDFIEEPSKFLAGDRLRRLRKELSLTPSEFVERLSLTSEKKYRDIETDKAECSLPILREIHDLTGASLEWLKHGLGPEYEVQYLPWPNVSEAVQQLIDLSPELILVTCNRRNLFLGLSVRIGEFRYKVFKLELRLDFWTWVDQHWAIPRFYVFLYYLFGVFGYRAQGRQIRQRDHQKLYKGEIHPYAVLKQNGIEERYWVESLLDIRGTSSPIQDFEKAYGKRFVRAQQFFRRYEESIAESLNIDEKDLPFHLQELGWQAVKKSSS
jgi:transcriptional regulator with XRE-family HTH domain